MREGFYALLHEIELHFYVKFYVKPNRRHVEIQENNDWNQNLVLGEKEHIKYGAKNLFLVTIMFSQSVSKNNTEKYN